MNFNKIEIVGDHQICVSKKYVIAFFKTLILVSSAITFYKMYCITLRSLCGDLWKMSGVGTQ